VLRLPGNSFLYVTLGRGSSDTNVRWMVHADLQPFMGGTYFPPKDAFGRPGFTTVLQRISEVWRSKQAMVEEQTADVMRQLEEHTKPQRAHLWLHMFARGRAWLPCCYLAACACCTAAVL
jgi:uncharacterized protein YyaL (SSP411 family)